MHVVHLQRTWPLLSQGTTDGALQSLARSPAIFFANASEITRCIFRSMSISLYRDRPLSLSYSVKAAYLCSTYYLMLVGSARYVFSEFGRFHCNSQLREALLIASRLSQWPAAATTRRGFWLPTLGSWIGSACTSGKTLFAGLAFSM